MKENYEWIRMVILSCKNEWQLECCKVLVTMFFKKHIYTVGVTDDFWSLCDTYNEQLKGLPNLPG